MAFQTVFKRYELKYMLTLEQKEKILEAMAPYMALDKYGRITIRNVYFENVKKIQKTIDKKGKTVYNIIVKSRRRSSYDKVYKLLLLLLFC